VRARVVVALLLLVVAFVTTAVVAAYVVDPSLGAMLLPADVDADLITTFIAVDVLFFVALPLAAAGALVRARPHAYALLCAHAGAAGFAGVWAWTVVATSGAGLEGALLMTPELVALPIALWALRPGESAAREALLAPARTDAPGTPVALFDGHCPFCRASVEHVRGWAGPGAITFVSLHDESVATRFPGLPPEAMMRAVHLVLPDGRVTEGAEAVIRAVSTRPGLGWLTAVYLLPGVRAVIDVGYAVVALKRYRLPGQACTDDVCEIPQH
jgi:predicted DCC family thiol-disulfide oxidoreductase YuxK